METIRPYRQEDRENVRNLCLINAGNPEKERQQKFILNTFCDYYIECEPENCFVAANEDNEAVGYIICAENYGQFERRIKSDYLPRALWLGPDKWIGLRLSYAPHKKFSREYPAHLHIDISADYRRKGLGSALMNTLTEHLRNKGVKGLMLTVGKKNEKGINFYKKYGFEVLQTGTGSVAMGIKL